MRKMARSPFPAASNLTTILTALPVAVGAEIGYNQPITL